MKELGTAVLAIVGAIITLAIVSVIISPRSQSAQVISAAGGFFSNVIAAAVNPQATALTNASPHQNAFSTPAGMFPPGFDIDTDGFDEQGFGQFLGAARMVAGVF